MKIEAVDIVQLRNMPVPRKGKKKLPVPDQGVSTVVQLHLSGVNGQRETGLGEIRAMGFLTGESANGAYGFAQHLGEALIGAEIPAGLSGREALRASHDLMAEATRRAFGIEAENPLPDSLCPSVRFGFDCALLDAMARAAGQSVVALLGVEGADPVRRNVLARSFAQPSALLNSLLQGNRPQGWLRGSYARGGATLASVVGAVAAATAGHEGEMKGLCFDLAGRWRPQEVALLLEGLNGTAAVRGSDFELVLEQPFPGRATAWYREAIATVAEADPALAGRIRFVLKEDLTSAAALEPMARLMPHVDLRLTPQKCASLHGVLTLLDRARELGFAGRLHLGNAGMNTELNSIMLVTLAQLLAEELGAEVLFSAGPKREDASRIRQAWPQVESDEETGTRLSPPEGPGWGARLCRSGLEKRLRKCDFLRMAAVTVDPASLRSLMISRAFDDSTLDIRQIDFDPEEEEDHPYGSDPDGEDPEEGDEARDDGTDRA
jgi:L-alanine-DL-glutamate epimerase-like enolase superfamily enzyme